MSGAEVAGFVLAAIPLVISALEHYKSGKGKAAAFMKYRGLLDTLLLRLKTQRTLFYLNVMILLKAAGINDLTCQHEEDCVKLLLSDETAITVRKYLDFTYGTFEDIVHQYERCLKKIVAKIANIKRTPNASKDDLHAVIEANPLQAGKFAFSERLDFTIERSSLKTLIDDLKEENLTLEKIIKGMRTMHEFEPSVLTGEAAELAKSFQRIQGLAKSLYTAVSKGWTSCCHPSHKVMIHLDDRLSILQAKQKRLKSLTAPVSFGLFLCSTDAGCHIWNEAAVQVIERASHDAPSTMHTAGLKIPSISICAPPNSRPASPASDEHVTDICKKIQEARCQKQALLLRLSTDTLYIPTNKTNTPEGKSYREYSSTMDLGHFLAQTLHREEYQLEYKERTNLALSLACSILQLNSTQWFTGAWTKNAIYFFVKNATTFDIYSERPSITQTVGNPVIEPENGSNGPDPKIAILELGILLLEIWHHKPLETWVEERGDQVNNSLDGRRSTAIRWLEVTQNKLPPNHLKAVEACLQFSAGRLREWGEDDFRKQVCEDIIKPLQENCKAW